MIFSNSSFLWFKTPSLTEIVFLAASNTFTFSANSSFASRIFFSLNLISKPCISISLLMASNSRLFFTLSLCVSYLASKASLSLIAAFLASMYSVIPLISSSILVCLFTKPCTSSSKSFTSIGNSPRRILI